MRLLRRLLTLSLTSAVAVLGKVSNTLERWLKSVRLPDEHPGIGRPGKIVKAGEPCVLASPENCLQTIIDGLEDEVMIIGPDLRVRQANRAVQRRLGMPADSIMGQPCFRISHGADEPCRPPWRECPLNRVLETGQSVRVVHTEAESQKAEGGEKWIEVVASPLWDSLGRVTEVVELIRDVSESKKLQKQVLRANRELLALNSIARALSQSLDLRATLQAVVETMLDALEAQASWVKLSNDVTMTSAVRASRGLPAKALDELIQAAPDVSSATGYPPVSLGDQSWQFAVTQLKSKGDVLGMAGVASQRPFDGQRIQLLEAIGHQIVVAIEKCRLYEEVQLTRDLRGELLHRVITAQEEERRRIARELHDETGQSLTALRLCLERLALVSASSTAEQIKAQLVHSLNLCQQADEQVDKLIFDLRPALLDDLGLVEAIESYARTRLGTAGVKVELTVTGSERRLSNEREVALFRVAQESITNIIKHAQAKNAAIHLRFKTDRLVAEIEDDGCGFEVNQVETSVSPKRGMGLLGMRERMSLVGGRLSIISRPGAGTRIKAEVPLDGKGALE